MGARRRDHQQCASGRVSEADAQRLVTKAGFVWVALALTPLLAASCARDSHEKRVLPPPGARGFAPLPKRAVAVCAAAQQGTTAALLCPRKAPTGTRGVFPEQPPDPLAAERLSLNGEATGVSLAYGVPGAQRDGADFFHFTIEVYRRTLGSTPGGTIRTLGKTRGRLSGPLANDFGLYSGHIRFLFSRQNVRYLATLHTTRSRAGGVALLAGLVEELVPVNKLRAATRPGAAQALPLAGVWALALSGPSTFAVVAGTRASVDPIGRAPAGLFELRPGGTRRKVSLPIVPAAAAFDGRSLWVAGRLTPSQRGGVVVRAAGGETLSRALGVRVADVVAGATGSWVAVASPPSLVRLDSRANVVQSFDLPAPPARVAAAAGRACATSPTTGELFIIRSGRVVRVRIGGSPFAVVLTRRGCVVATQEGSLAAVEWDASRPSTTGEVGGTPVALTADGDTIYLANLTGRAVQVIDAESLAVRDVISIDGDPTAVAIRGRSLVVGTNSRGVITLAR